MLIAASYDIAESNIYRGIRWVEDTLIKDGTFSLPGRKALLKSDVEYEVILVDATETPIERPQKNRRNTTPERKNIIPSSAASINLWQSPSKSNKENKKQHLD